MSSAAPAEISTAQHFAHFELRPQRRQLWVRGELAVLGSRAFDVLLLLVEHRSRLVTKDELLQRVWPGVVVEENNLQVQVSALRKLLGAQAITTVPGRGYRFTAEPLDAPTTAADARTIAGAGTDPGQPAAEPAAASPAQLLVADDNKVNRLLLARSLQLMGHEVSVAENGRQALEKLRAGAFDLLLLDLEMPELDGFAVLERLAADAELRELSVIVTSSVEGAAPVARCIELGADDFLHKPVNPLLLKARVGASLDKRRQRQEQRALIARLRSLAATAGPSAAAGPATADRAPPAEFARRTSATVLAVRLADLESEADAAATLELLDACQTLWRDAVLGHGGAAFGDRADGLLALFGHTTASAQAAELAALRAALEMAEMLDVLNAERAALGKAAVRPGIGLASGALLVGAAGPPGERRLACIGDAVQRALLLEAHAAAVAGGLLLDSSVAAAVAGRVATETLALPQGQAHRVRTG